MVNESVISLSTGDIVEKLDTGETGTNYFTTDTVTGPQPRISVFEKEINKHLAEVAPADRLLVANLQMFSAEVDDYSAVHDVADADTLAVLAGLEAGEGL